MAGNGEIDVIWIILHNGVRYQERGPAVSEKSKRGAQRE